MSMSLMHFIKNIFKKTNEKPGTFSEFLLHASVEQKTKVFKEAARRANEDQRKILEEAKLRTRVS